MRCSANYCTRAFGPKAFKVSSKATIKPWNLSLSELIATIGINFGRGPEVNTRGLLRKPFGGPAAPPRVPVGFPGKLKTTSYRDYCVSWLLSTETISGVVAGFFGINLPAVSRPDPAALRMSRDPPPTRFGVPGVRFPGGAGRESITPICKAPLNQLISAREALQS